MNKLSLFFIVIFVLGSTSAFSIDINLAKDSYFPGETLQADITIEGVLEENLANSNIKLYCSNNSIGISPSLIKLSNTHYYSFFEINKALYGQNCEFTIQDAIFYESGFIMQRDFSKNFSLVSTNDSIVSINPSAFRVDDLSDQNTFRVFVENLGIESVNLSISTSNEFVDLTGDLSGDPESSSYFDIYLSELLYSGEENAEVEISYNSKGYKIPIWIFEDVEDNNITVPEENESYIDGPFLEFVMDVDRFDISLSSDEDLSGYVTIKNVGVDLRDIVFSLSGNLSGIIDLQTENLELLESGESFKEYLYVNQMKNAEEGIYEGVLKIDYYSESLEFPILVEIKSGEVVSNGTNGDPVDPGNPPVEENGISIWWFVLIILLIALIVLYFLYKKKTKKNPDFLPPRV